MVKTLQYPPLSPVLVLASHNQGKLLEIRALLSPYGLDVIDAAAARVDEPEETGKSFIENAELKARYSATCTGLCALSDDSGLVVPALDGAPGIYSARWAGPEKNFVKAMEKLETALQEKQLRPTGTPAYFACALSLAWPSGEVLSVEGQVHGHLHFPPAGNKGFGYDPVFKAQGYDVTFAEMEPNKKHSISHRADAFQQLLDALSRYGLMATSAEKGILQK